MILETSGIYYSHEQEWNFVGYKYLWRKVSDIDGKLKTGESIVYCLNESSFLKLLFYWSYGGWEYEPVRDNYGYIPVIVSHKK